MCYRKEKLGQIRISVGKKTTFDLHLFKNVEFVFQLSQTESFAVAYPILHPHIVVMGITAVVCGLYCKIGFLSKIFPSIEAINCKPHEHKHMKSEIHPIRIKVLFKVCLNLQDTRWQYVQHTCNFHGMEQKNIDYIHTRLPLSKGGKKLKKKRSQHKQKYSWKIFLCRSDTIKDWVIYYTLNQEIIPKNKVGLYCLTFSIDLVLCFCLTGIKK